MKAIDHCLSIFLLSVQQEMKRRGITQTELAKRLDIARPYLWKVLHGEINITFGAAMRLAKALGKDFRPKLCNPIRNEK